MKLRAAGSLASTVATTVATVVVAAAVAGCDAPPPPVRTVTDLAADPVVLQGLVSRCAADPVRARNDVECENARRAMERLAAQEEASRAAAKAAEFERQRTLRREREERQRAAEKSGERFDPYSSPVVVEPATTAGGPPAAPAPAAPAAPPR